MIVCPSKCSEEDALLSVVCKYCTQRISTVTLYSAVHGCWELNGQRNGQGASLSPHLPVYPVGGINVQQNLGGRGLWGCLGVGNT